MKILKPNDKWHFENYNLYRKNRFLTNLLGNHQKTILCKFQSYQIIIHNSHNFHCECIPVIVWIKKLIQLMKEMFRVTCFLFCLLGTLYLETMTLLSRVNLGFTERLDITALWICLAVESITFYISEYKLVRCIDASIQYTH